MNQLLLPEVDREDLPIHRIPPAAPYQRHSDTSRAAAEAILPRLPRLELAVLRALARCGEEGATDHELMALTGLEETARPRRIKLVELGLAAASGRKRPSRKGHAMMVWTITEMGREALDGADL